jgi:hypothetical protein
MPQNLAKLLQQVEYPRSGHSGCERVSSSCGQVDTMQGQNTQGQKMSCGQGVAANAVLPEKVGVLMGSMAALLQNHTRSLDAADSNTKQERDAYHRLIKELGAVASSSQALAAAMRSYRDLPNATHDVRVLADQKSRDVFASFIRAEEDVHALLQTTVAEHRAMLNAMTGS